ASGRAFLAVCLRFFPCGCGRGAPGPASAPPGAAGRGRAAPVRAGPASQATPVPRPRPMCLARCARAPRPSPASGPAGPPSPRRLLFLAFLSAGPTFRLSAQDPADRRVIEGLRDSLGAVTDSTALLRLEARAIDVAKHDRDNPLIHLRLGFVAYRLGELANSKKHYDDAAGEFEWATELRPDWPYPWYGVGLAELAQGEHSVLAVENLRQQL